MQYGTEVLTTLNPITNIHTVAKWEYLGRDILPSLWFTNSAFIRNAAMAIDSVYGRWNMQIWTIIELSDDSNKSSDDGKNGTWKFVVSGKNAAWEMVSKTVTIIRTTKVETVNGKKKYLPVFTYTITNNTWNKTIITPTTYSTTEWDWANMSLIGNHTPSFTFTENTRAGFTQVLREELSVDPTLAFRAWDAIQSKLNELNGWVKLKIKSWSTIKHDPNTKTFVCTMDGVTITTTYWENNSIISTTYTGALNTSNNANFAPVTYSTTSWGKSLTGANAAIINNPIIGEDWFANVTAKWLWNSLKICLSGIQWSITAEDLWDRIWGELNTWLTTNIYNKFPWSALQADSKVKTERLNRNQVHITLKLRKPKAKKWWWFIYDKNITILNFIAEYDGRWNVTQFDIVQ